VIVCLALSYNSQLSCVLSSCPLCVCSYQQRCCPNVWCHIRHHCYWVSCLSRSYCRSPLCGPSRVAAVVSVVPSRKTLYENAVCPRLSSTSARFVCSTTRPPSFLQESLSLFVDLVCCHTFQRHVRRNFYVPGHIWSQRYIWCHVSKND